MVPCWFGLTLKRGHNMRNLPGLHKCRIAVLRVMRALMLMRGLMLA
jgi:hypothetical protein